MTACSKKLCWQAAAYGLQTVRASLAPAPADRRRFYCVEKRETDGEEKGQVLCSEPSSKVLALLFVVVWRFLLPFGDNVDQTSVRVTSVLFVLMFISV